MAACKEHVAVAAAVSAAAITITSSFHIVTQIQLVYLFLIGVVSTLLPDLDSDTSRPLRLFYNFLSLVLPFFALFLLIRMNYLENYENNLLKLMGFYLIILVLVFSFFRGVIFLTKHRGIFHSLIMAIFFSLIVMYCMLYLKQNEKFILLSGFFAILGYVVHLILDEIYSVFGLKKSFGSALKLFPKENLMGSVVVLFIVCILFVKLPFYLKDYVDIFFKFIDFFKK